MEKSYPSSSRTPYLVFGLLLLILFSGCTPISKELRAQTDRTVGFQQVFQNPEAHKGKIVIWGGEIIETINQKDGTTLIVVLQRPLKNVNFNAPKEDSLSSLWGTWILMSSREGRESPSQEKS
jgi:starvation-inducible outer membrane lipoprotein